MILIGMVVFCSCDAKRSLRQMVYLCTDAKKKQQFVFDAWVQIIQYA